MRDPQLLQNLVQTAMDAILVRHDRAEVRKHFHPDFVQHNPWAEDGGAHVEAMCDFSFGVKMSRWAVQGDLVAYHGLYTAPNPLGEHPLLCVDVWRVQGDRIVEHWDALHPTPQAEALLAGEGDGFANVAPDRVAANAAAARKRLELGDSEHRSDSTAKFTVRKTIASGDLVFVQLEAQNESKAQAGFHIYRFTPEGKIAQRWEVLQDRVPLDQAANPHPHF